MSVIDVPMLPWIGTRATRASSRWLVTRSIRKQIKNLGLDQPIVFTTLPHVSWLLGDIGQTATVYYCTDDYSQWPMADRRALEYSERLLLEKADLALAVSQHLMDRCAGARQCEYFPHAVDYGLFSQVSEIPAHENITKLPGPRIGFFGLIYEKIDFDLLTKLALEYADGSIVLIGPVDYCPESFIALPNTHLIPAQPYEELPQWLAGLDVLLMPYVMDKMILQSNPLKLRECLATGKPTICVDIPEARRFEPHVSVNRTHSEFIDAVCAAVDASKDTIRAAQRQDSVRTETWDARATELSELLTNFKSQNRLVSAT